MDPELAALASSAATALVGRLAADGWDQARQAVVALWRRRHPERPEEAEVVEAQLVEAREELLAAGAAGEAGDGRVGQELTVEWRTRLRDLLRADPALAVELRRVLAELEGRDGESGAGAAPGGNRVTMRATAADRAKVYMAGNDLHIHGQ
ncbi:hypothetical protein [Streptomyces rubellomurinus]|uniref:Uncharacterized protein n=1 Tax=Streptomyces rubellomurinus (strain ATCC 31215) TaxID=359131 RepID=A0A0F2TDB9_STRR3|nr:hypothetical protein [Streptomyces rubellomurinus]KJS60501.1 hypothetical protein VM95_20820 [Streptomyces rubellomurinus]